MSKQYARAGGAERNHRGTTANRSRGTARVGDDGRPDWSPRPPRAERSEERRRDHADRRPARGDRRTDRTDRERRPQRPPRPQRERADAVRAEPREDVVLERLVAIAAPADGGDAGFADLGLGDNIVRALAALGATSPFPIQAATIPVALEGRDVLGRGRTGSGKTIAFGAPVVERLLRLHRERHPGGAKGRAMGRSPRAVILAPTRELAQQIDRTVQPIARSVGLFTIAIVGGVPYQKQLTGLRRGVDIVIGTPGRIEDLLDKGELDLADVAVTVVDEADHMCDLGFLEPVQRIIRETPAGGQRLLFSATLDTAVAALVDEFLADPAVYEVAGEDEAPTTIEHRVRIIDASAKREQIVDLVGGAERAIVFTRTRAFAEDVAEHLADAGIAATSLHGDLNQARRNRNLQQLASGRVRVLVATDVAARGIHVDGIELVVQADLAEDHKTYLHRAGRTGRAGAEGVVVTLISPSRRRRTEALLANAGVEAAWEDVATTRPRGPRTPRGERPRRDS